MKKILFVFSLLSLLVLFGCQKNNTELCPINWTWYSCTTESWDQSFEITEKEILTALRWKNIEKLSTFIGEKWVRLSPYSYVNTGIDVVLKRTELSWLRNSSEKIERWSYDWSGAPIIITMKEYREKFIYDEDFEKAPDRLVNQKKERWNTINNAFEIYSGATLVEYYFSWFDSMYEWIDWKSLILVLDKEWNEWKLIGIIHWQRTI